MGIEEPTSQKRQKATMKFIRRAPAGVKSQTLRAIKASAIAWHIPRPSLGDVPLPNSSISTRELQVARPSSKGNYSSKPSATKRTN